MNESRIGQLGKARGWTQEHLAAESGIAVRTVQRLEAATGVGTPPESSDDTQYRACVTN